MSAVKKVSSVRKSSVEQRFHVLRLLGYFYRLSGFCVLSFGILAGLFALATPSYRGGGGEGFSFIFGGIIGGVGLFGFGELISLAISLEESNRQIASHLAELLKSRRE